MPPKRSALVSSAGFDVAVRHLAMEYDAMDLDTSGKLDFREFSKLVRAREMAIHTEEALRQRFEDLDADGSGTVDVPEFIKFALRDALARTALPVASLLASWDSDQTGDISLAEFRDAVRFFGFEARDAEIDAVFHEFDVNHNGSLDIVELTRTLEGGAMPEGMKQHKVRQMRDREGFITQSQASVELAAASAERDAAGRAPAHHLRQQVAELRRTLLALLASSQARVMDLFRAWDANGDGLIGAKELEKALGVLGVVAPPKVVRALLKTLDKDGDGTLQYRELNSALRPPRDADGENAEGAGAKRPPIEVHATTRAAIRKRASEQEFSKTLGSTFALHLDPLPVEEAVDAGGAGSGAGAAQLLLRQLTEGLRQSWGKVSALFREWDADGDGLISRDEMRRAMKRLGLGGSSPSEKEAVQEALASLFAAIDTDGSGAISLRELERAVRPPSRRSATSGALAGEAPLAARMNATRSPKQRVLLKPPHWPHVPPLFDSTAGGSSQATAHHAPGSAHGCVTDCADTAGGRMAGGPWQSSVGAAPMKRAVDPRVRTPPLQQCCSPAASSMTPYPISPTSPILPISPLVFTRSSASLPALPTMLDRKAASPTLMASPALLTPMATNRSPGGMPGLRAATPGPPLQSASARPAGPLSEAAWYAAWLRAQPGRLGHTRA